MELMRYEQSRRKPMVPGTGSPLLNQLKGECYSHIPSGVYLVSIFSVVICYDKKGKPYWEIELQVLGDIPYYGYVFIWYLRFDAKRSSLYEKFATHVMTNEGRSLRDSRISLQVHPDTVEDVIDALQFAKVCVRINVVTRKGRKMNNVVDVLPFRVWEEM